MTRISEILNNFFLNLSNLTASVSSSAAPQMFDFEVDEPGDTLEMSTEEAQVEESASINESGKPASRLKIGQYTKVQYATGYSEKALKDSQNHLLGLIRFFESDGSDHNKPKTIKKNHNGQVYTFKSYGVVDPWALDENPPANESQAYDLMLKYLDEVAYADILNEFIPPADCSKIVAVHVVKKGDKLSSIAAKYPDRSVNDLLRANPGLTSKLTIGQKINIPAKGQPTKEAYYAALPQSVKEALLDYNYRNGGSIWRSNSKKFKAALDKGLTTSNWNDFLSLLTSSQEKGSEGLSKRGFARVLLATRSLPKTEELKKHIKKLYNEALGRASNHPQDVKDMYDLYINGKITDKNSSLYNKKDKASTSTTQTTQSTALQPQKTSNQTDANQVIHKVRSGDTLGAIAIKYGTTVDAIKKLNGMKNDNIREGQELKIPSGAKSSSLTHKVRSGDTLGAIAIKYGTTVDAIKKLNNLKSDNIDVGQVLKIPKK